VNVGILGNGNLAVALGRAWAAAGHMVVVTGRNLEHAREAVHRIGSTAEAVAAGEFARRADVVVIAVAWEGLEAVVELIGGPQGSLAGMTLIDCTNPVDFTTGAHRTKSGSAAETVAFLAPGSYVVKALHLFAGTSWPYTAAPQTAPVVAICGDERSALEQTARLIADLGGNSAVVGALATSRQAEETAGFVMRVLAAGFNPRLAVPDVDPTLLGLAPAASA
jgi:8-hydroxy-5-deazaflavin:NADPH oxidoreductase